MATRQVIRTAGAAKHLEDQELQAFAAVMLEVLGSTEQDAVPFVEPQQGGAGGGGDARKTGNSGAARETGVGGAAKRAIVDRRTAS